MGKTGRAQKDRIIMDNFKIDVVADNIEALKLSLQLCLMAHRTVTHWAEVPPRLGVMGQSEKMRPHVKRLVLFWTEPKNVPGAPHVNRMLGGGNVDTLATMIWGWLEEQEKALREARVSAIGHDSDVQEETGFHLWNDAWGHVQTTPDYDSWEGVAQVEFCFTWIGK